MIARNKEQKKTKIIKRTITIRVCILQKLALICRLRSSCLRHDINNGEMQINTKFTVLSPKCSPGNYTKTISHFRLSDYKHLAASQLSEYELVITSPSVTNC